MIRAQALTQDSLGWWSLEGRMANVGDREASQVGLTVRFLDASDQVIDTKEAIMATDHLDARQEAHFSLIWPPDARIQTILLIPHWRFV